MEEITIKDVTSKEEIEKLKSMSAFTIEGLLLNEDNSGDLVDWLKENNAFIDGKQINAHRITGKLMNESYGLTNSNKYPNEVSIISFTNIDQMSLITARFSVGGRWLDDIIENNQNRE